MFQRLLFTCFMLFSFVVSSKNADANLEKVRAAYLTAGGGAKAFDQLTCFLRKNGNYEFRTKASPGNGRCDRKTIARKKKWVVSLIDYTKPSDQKRLFLLDLKNGKVKALHVSHGRFGETLRSNRQIRMKPKANSILKAVHFSNEMGKNASVGGFYLTGGEYEGAYGRSLILHGLEKNVNDNACARAVVIHKNHIVNDRGANIMSSGCPMVSNRHIDAVIDTLKSGSLIYMYSPIEAALSADSCGRNLLYSPRAMK